MTEDLHTDFGGKRFNRSLPVFRLVTVSMKIATRSFRTVHHLVTTYEHTNCRWEGLSKIGMKKHTYRIRDQEVNFDSG